jgi:hypothetical protein
MISSIHDDVPDLDNMCLPSSFSSVFNGIEKLKFYKKNKLKIFNFILK